MLVQVKSGSIILDVLFIFSLTMWGELQVLRGHETVLAESSVQKMNSYVRKYVDLLITVELWTLTWDEEKSTKYLNTVTKQKYSLQPAITVYKKKTEYLHFNIQPRKTNKMNTIFENSEILKY